MLEKTKLDLGVVDDLTMLTVEECKVYLSKLDYHFYWDEGLQFAFSFEGELLPRTRIAKL